MNIARKIELAVDHLTSIATHTDADFAVRIAALASIKGQIDAKTEQLEAERAAQVEDQLNGEPG